MARRQLSGARIIITGASSGIGQALAICLAEKGARLIVNARRSDLLEELKARLESIGTEIAIVSGDVTRPGTRRRIIEQAVSQFGGIDVLINNAGLGAMGRFSGANADRLRQIMEVNFFAPVEFIRDVLPMLSRERDPLVVNIGSVLGHFAVPEKSEYCASKFALRGFSESLRSELSGTGIGLLVVSPSTTDSEFFDRAVEDTTNRNWKRLGAMSPERVARTTISAMEKRKQEVVLSLGGRMLMWVNRLCPPLLRWIVRPRDLGE